MKILLHQCCGPCSLFPINILNDEKLDIFGYYYNPNIHPITEFYKRLQYTTIVNSHYNIKSIVNNEYDITGFVRNVAYRENNRCNYCYALRIEKTAQIAKRGKFDLFTTTLLYSKFQNHEIIREMCESAAKKHKIDFFYYDFREGWKEGIELSKQLDLYRQQYCGCIFSEEERFGKILSKKFANTEEKCI